MKRKNKYAAGVLHTLALMLLASACADDRDPREDREFEEGIPTEVSFYMSSRFNDKGTRADGNPANPENVNEKINDWFIVFIDKTGNVAKILNRSDTETGIRTDAGAVEAETFRCILPSGTYSAYAFANISATELSSATGLSFAGVNSIVTAQVDGKTWSTELNNWDISSKPIPMTGFLKNIEVKNTIEETFSIEVVRMVAKVEFQFSNPTDKDITVSNVSIDPVTTSSVSLFPKGSSGIDYSYLGNNAYTPLTGATYAPLNVALEKTVESSEDNVSVAFYMKESLSSRQNDNAFTVGIKVKHADGIQEHQQYNITKDITKYINRNDWIVIPITLSQYDVSVEALFYPPIGGYPAVLSTTAPDGSQVFTFGTEGEFAIVPKVIDKITGTPLSPAKYSIESVSILSEEISTSNPDETTIFTKSPTVTTTATSIPDEITGTLSTAKGKAKVEVKVNISDQTYNNDPIYTRTIYIIRK